MLNGHRHLFSYVFWPSPAILPKNVSILGVLRKFYNIFRKSFCLKHFMAASVKILIPLRTKRPAFRTKFTDFFLVNLCFSPELR